MENSLRWSRPNLRTGATWDASSQYDPATGLYEQLPAITSWSRSIFRSTDRKVPIDSALGPRADAALASGQAGRRGRSWRCCGRVPGRGCEIISATRATLYAWQFPARGHPCAGRGTARQTDSPCIFFAGPRPRTELDPGAGGIRIAGLGGLWRSDIGFAGLGVDGDAITLTPRLPEDWRSVSFAVRWRGRPVQLQLPAIPCVAISDGDPSTSSRWRNPPCRERWRCAATRG